MPLKWIPINGVDGMQGGLVPVAELIEFDEPAENETRQTKATDWELHCDRHWDTGAPDEWIASCAPKKINISFPTKAEAMTYAEVTYALGASNATDVEGV